MDPLLDPIETRVLGCLIEKELATPEYYPLTLNALVNACNQKSNRDPVVELSADEVSSALFSLTHAQLAIVAGEGGRSTKYRHFLCEKLGLEPPALAVLCELMVRGPQTPGELRTRTARMVALDDVGGVAAVLEQLEQAAPPLITWLSRQPGRKEQRVVQCLSELPEPESPRPVMSGASLAPRHETPPPAPVDVARTEALEADVAALRAEVEALRAELAELTRLVV